MILSVAPNEAIPYTGFSQISFIIVCYGGSLFMNYYGETLAGGNYAHSFGYMFLVLSVMSLVPLTIYTLYELFVATDDDLHMNELRRSQIQRNTQERASDLVGFQKRPSQQKEQRLSQQ